MSCSATERAGGGLPLMAHVILSDRCNHACLHCYQVHGQRGEMTTGEVIKAFDELAAAGVLVLAISGGEVSLRSDLLELLRAARARNFAFTLQTNGYDWSDELVREVARLGVWQVRVSVYSCVPDEHDMVTRVPGSFARTMATVGALRALDVPVRLIVTLTSCTSSTKEEFAALAAVRGCALEMASLVTAREDASTRSQGVAPTHEQLRTYYASGERDAVPSVTDKLEERPCGVCSSSFTLHADGSLRPCAHIPLELSHVSEERIGELADLDAYRAFSSIRWRDVHGCRDCALLPVCARCHGSSAFETGDLLGPQPSACRVALARFDALEGGIELVENPAVLRDREIGPFERLAGRMLRPVADVRFAADDILAARLAGDSRAREASGILPVSTLVRRRLPSSGSTTEEVR